MMSELVDAPVGDVCGRALGEPPISANGELLPPELLDEERPAAGPPPANSCAIDGWPENVGRTGPATVEMVGA